MSRLTHYIDATFVNDPLPALPPLPGGGGSSSSASALEAAGFSVVQGSDSKWYVIDTQTGRIAAGPFENNSIANYVLDNGTLGWGRRLTPPPLPSALQPAQGSGFRTRQFEQGWAVIDKNGNRVSDFFSSESKAKGALEAGEINTGGMIQPPSRAGGAGPAFYQGAGFAEGLDLDQIGKAVRDGVVTPEAAMNTLIRDKNLSPDAALRRLIADGAVTPDSTLQGISVLGQGTQQAPAQTVTNTQAQGWWSAPITQGFGPTNEKLDSGYAGYANFNKGIDFALAEGTPITANIGGTVIAAGDQGDGWGISVKVRDAQGNVHNYGHLSSANVQPGQTINVGDLLGASGNTGKSTGPHLSYDVMNAQGEFFEPSQFLQGVQAPQQGEQAYTGDNADFYNTFGPAALAFAERYGVDPAFLLGMAASETNWGAASGFNVGGIMGTGTAGSKQFVSQGSDAPGSVGTFAQYNSPEEGYQAFFDLITQGRYANAWQAFQQHGDSARLYQDLQQAGYTPATDWPGLVTSLAQQVQTALSQGAGGTPSAGLQQPGADTPQQQTRREQAEAAFRAGQITEAERDAIYAAIDAEKAAAASARATAAYDAQQKQAQAAFDAYASRLNTRVFKTGPASGFYYDEQGRQVPIGYVAERGRVETGTPVSGTRFLPQVPGGYSTNAGRAMAIEQSAVLSDPTGGRVGVAELANRAIQSQGGAAQAMARSGTTNLADAGQFFGETVGMNAPVMRTTITPNGGMFTVSPTEAARIATASPGERAQGLYDLLGYNPTLSEQNALIGSSTGGSGFDISMMQLSGVSAADQYQTNYQHFLSTGMSPAEADWRAKIQVEGTRYANSLRTPPAPGLSESSTNSLIAQGYQRNPDTGAFRVNTGVDPATGETTYRDLGQSEAYLQSTQTLSSEEWAGIKSSLLDQAQGLGYSIVPGPNGWQIVDADGNVILNGFDTLEQAQSQLAIGMHHRQFAPNNTVFAPQQYRNYAPQQFENNASRGMPIAEPQPITFGSWIGPTRPTPVRPTPPPVQPVQPVQPTPTNVYSGTIYQPPATPLEPIAPAVVQPLEPLPRGRNHQRELSELEMLVA